jgi:hypothetical protein
VDFFLKLEGLGEGRRLKGLLSTTYPHREKSFEVEGWTQRWGVFIKDKILKERFKKNCHKNLRTRP